MEKKCDQKGKSGGGGLCINRKMKPCESTEWRRPRAERELALGRAILNKGCEGLTQDCWREGSSIRGIAD